MMQTTISEGIRQLRRQRGMTQTELGGTHFSKSYVSAVELEKIAPSYEALRFFAKQLEQPTDYFMQFAEQPTRMLSRTSQGVSSAIPQNEIDEQEKYITLLDMILEGKELPYASFSQKISALSLEALLHLPLQKQAYYCLLKGLILQEQRNLQEARPLLERALALSPTKHQSAILDALGTNVALTHSYQVALDYHHRALQIVEHEPDRDVSSLVLNIKLHCGDDYRALGLHGKALEQYEDARQSLRSTSHVEIAGKIYMGLGYCTYASIYQDPVSTAFSYQEKEHLLQQAASFLSQCRTLYQVSSNQVEEAKVQLLHVIILLGICALRQQGVRERAQDVEMVELQCAAILDEAEEQCRHILMSWNEPVFTSDQSSYEVEIVFYSALSSLVRIFVQRASFARLQGDSNTALHERIRATHLCQRVLDTLSTPELLYSLLRTLRTLEDEDGSRVQVLPHLPDIKKSWLARNSISIATIFSAAGEVAEELGRATTNLVYASDCYTYANMCFKTSLHRERQITFSQDHDVSFLLRSYQRSIALLEDRLRIMPGVAEETYQMMFELFKDMVYHPL